MIFFIHLVISVILYNIQIYSDTVVQENVAYIPHRTVILTWNQKNKHTPHTPFQPTETEIWSGSTPASTNWLWTIKRSRMPETCQTNYSISNDDVFAHLFGEIQTPAANLQQLLPIFCEIQTPWAKTISISPFFFTSAQRNWKSRPLWPCGRWWWQSEIGSWAAHLGATKEFWDQKVEN